MALHTAPAIALVLAFILYRHFIYPAFLSPLSNIPPVHRTASILPGWLWWQERNGTLARRILAAHELLGPVVRVGPREVHAASLDGLRVTFSGKFERPTWFLKFSNFDGVPNLFSTLDLKRHTTRRRMVMRVYTKSFIHGCVHVQDLLRTLLFDRLVPVFEGAARTGEGVDVYGLAWAAGAEFTNAYQVGTGQCLDLMRNGREHERKVYLENGKAKVLGLKGHKRAARELEEQILETCRKAEDFLASMPTEEKEGHVVKEHAGSTSTYPVIYAQLKSLIPETEGVKTLQEILLLTASEFLDNLEASRVGIGITLTYVLYELSLRPDLQSTLRTELMTLEQPFISPPGENRISTATLRKLDGLRLLDAVVTETMRAHQPINVAFPRVAPKGGATIDGFFIPAGVTVWTSPYPLHMNQGAYPNPKQWNPERWLDIHDTANAETQKSGPTQEENGRADSNPRRWFWAFGSGSSNCAGQNFALLVMKAIVASIYTNYTTCIIDDAGIEQSKGTVNSPAEEKLVLGFNRIPKV